MVPVSDRTTFRPRSRQPLHDEHYQTSVSILYIHPSLLLVALLSLPCMVRAQSCAFDLGPDRELCHGESVLLAGPTGSVSIQWQNGGVAQYLTADTSGIYWCTATFPVPGQDLVVNGDFGDGDTGFSTDLALGTAGPWGPLSSEGTYGVTNDPSQLHYNFPSCADHTGDGSGMLLVNGSGTPDASIWCQTIAVQPGTYFAFSAWLMSAYWESPANLEFTVNGVSVGAPLLALSTTCQWNEFYALWSSGTNTSATICITNQNLAGSGNDFALDDIAFRPLCTHTDSVVVSVLPAPPGVSITGDDRLCPGEATTLEATLDGPWPLTDVQLEWEGTTAGSSYVATAPGAYEVVASGRCLNATRTFVVVADTCSSSLRMPNVFTPNGDGHNDIYLPIVQGQPTDYELVIRNRWGQEVFRSMRVGTGWDGRVEGAFAPDGTYYWAVRYTERRNDGTSSPQESSGHLTLLGRP